MRKIIFTLSFFSVFLSAGSNAALVGADNSVATWDDLCQFEAKDPRVSFIDLQGTKENAWAPETNWTSVTIGDTQGWLKGRDTTVFTNQHNGAEIVEKRKCGIPDEIIRDTTPRLAGFLITTPEYYTQRLSRNFSSKGFFIRDLPILTNDPFVKKRMYSYEGKEINQEMLNSMIRDIIVIMRDKNQPVVDVYFPEQDVTDGFIVALVSRAVVDKIVVNGNQYYTEDDIKKFVNVKPGDYIWSDTLSQDLRWINSYPYRSVDVIMKPGSKPRTTDVIFETRDMYPFRVFGGVDNYGAPSTDENEFYAGFSYGNLFGLDHELIYSFGSSFQTDEFYSHNLQYIIPFDWRHKLALSASISESETDTNNPLFNVSGENIVLNANYEVPLYDWGFRGFTQAMDFGLDYKKLSNDIEFGGANVFTSEPEVVQGYVTYEGSKASNRTSNSISLTGVFSPGGLTGNNSDDDFDIARAGADSQYVYGKSTYETSYSAEELGGLTLSGLFRGQYSPEKLLATEQASVAGPGAVRGFSANTVRRDSSFIATVEAASPYVSILDDYLGTALRDRVQGFVFLDKGYGKNAEESGAQNTVDLDSAGVGARFGLGRNLNGVVEFGKEIKDEMRDGKDEQLHFRLNAAY